MSIIPHFTFSNWSYVCVFVTLAPQYTHKLLNICILVVSWEEELVWKAITEWKQCATLNLMSSIWLMSSKTTKPSVITIINTWLYQTTRTSGHRKREPLSWSKFLSGALISTVLYHLKRKGGSEKGGKKRKIIHSFSTWGYNEVISYSVSTHAQTSPHLSARTHRVEALVAIFHPRTKGSLSDQSISIWAGEREAGQVSFKQRCGLRALSWLTFPSVRTACPSVLWIIL